MDNYHYSINTTVNLELFSDMDWVASGALHSLAVNHPEIFRLYSYMGSL